MSTHIVSPIANPKSAKEQQYPIKDNLRQAVEQWDRIAALRESSLFNIDLPVAIRLEIARRLADACERAFCLIAATTPN